MKHLLPALLLAVSCAQFEYGRDLSYEDVAGISLGKTRGAELVARLGPPALNLRPSDYGPTEAPNQMVWTHTESRGAAVSLVVTTIGSAEATVEKLTVYVDPETDTVSSWSFEGWVNGAWQVLGPNDTPLTEAEVKAMRGEA